MKNNNTGFYIIEILIGIFIFTLGLVSAYALIITTMKLNEYSKNSIIASNLAREGIELVRNVRDSNYQNIYKWNKIPGSNPNMLFQTGVYYKIENNLGIGMTYPIGMKEILDFGEGQNELNGKMENYQLYLNSQNLYTYDSNNGNKKTYFYRYIKFDDVRYSSGGINYILKDSLKLTSKVIWYSRGYHEIQLDTVLTDFLRQ